MKHIQTNKLHLTLFLNYGYIIDVDVYRAGVNLLRFVEVVQPAVLFKLFCAYRRNVHEAGIFFIRGGEQVVMAHEDGLFRA